MDYTIFTHKNIPSPRAVEMENSEGTRFMLNGQWIKIYLGYVDSVQEVVKAYYIDKVCVIKSPNLCRDVKSSTSLEATKDVQSS